METALKKMMEMPTGKAGKGKMKGKGKGKGKGKKGGKLMTKGAGKGSGQVVPANVPAQGFSRDRVPNAGIHTIEIYHPQFYFNQIEMEEFDAIPERFGPSVIGKYTKGIGQVEARYPTDDEDVVSYAMTTVHRLVERMEEKGINETRRYTPDKKTLPIWNAIGRIDVGTESIVDRSKSIKSYCMDMFERYGQETNVEGVDQYNACYGGQAAGLSVLNWVECDRWDGRYGIGVATDISETHHIILAFVGAACTATLFFPDAPLAHHSCRASCILHRFDFCKPAGWHDMGPVTDGKYSIECYMEGIDVCYQNIRKKLNDKPLVPISDYNVYHTGGGFHVVKKAFERFLRSDQPGIKQNEKAELLTKRLIPSTYLLKVIGPCHTVSSFLNISSVAMTEWDKALGKILIVFTYGSGSACSMYQVRFDDVPFYDPFPIFKLKFYEQAIHMHPSVPLHQPYVESWMKFDFRPSARQDFGVDLHTLEEDVYYLLEIDKFGRRFYHRGGMKGTPLKKEHRTKADVDEDRRMREHFPKLPPKAIEPEKKEDKSQMELWNEIEYSMTYDKDNDDEPDEIDLGTYRDRYEPEFMTQFVKPKDKTASTFAPDGLDHTYQIVGTWSQREPQDMTKKGESAWTFEITLGENRWEEFHIIQDQDPQKRIYPYMAKSYKDLPCVGPHDGGHDKNWFMDCRDRCTVDPSDMGSPGDKYLVTFSWQKMKQLKWERIQGATGDWSRGKYYIIGSWNSFEPTELEDAESERGEGWYMSPEVQMSSLGIEFLFCRNKDMAQKIYPIPDGDNAYPTNYYEPIGGPDGFASGHWIIDDPNKRSVYRIFFYRDPDDVEESGFRLEWEHVGEREPKEPPAEYFIVGDFNGWGSKSYLKMDPVPNQKDVYVAPVTISYDKDEGEDKTNVERFQILMHKRRDRCIHPNKDECTQDMKHDVVRDNLEIGNKCWHIGKSAADQATKGDVFNAQLLVHPDGKMDVSWTKASFSG